jgi:hypothetical protein
LNVTIDKCTPYSLMMHAFSATTYHDVDMDPVHAYALGHSPIRTQMFWIEIHGVTNRVHTHLVRHKIGVEWFVRTQRPDRVRHDAAYPQLRDLCAWANAQAIINISHMRLCHRAWVDTRIVWEAVREAMGDADKALQAHMVPLCVYRGGLCAERCGKYRDVMREYGCYGGMING